VCLQERLWDDDLVLGTESSSAGNSPAMDFYSSGGAMTEKFWDDREKKSQNSPEEN
jgi:hypothetical protein